jgi:S-adenosylmethionine decarboxylase
MKKEYKSPPIGHEISCVFSGIENSFLDKKDCGIVEKIINFLKEDGFGICGKIIKQFNPKGYTIMVLLSESHLAIHTYPEHNSFYFNMYSCRGENDSMNLFKKLKKLLKPKKIIYFSDQKVPVKN